MLALLCHQIQNSSLKNGTYESQRQGRAGLKKKSFKIMICFTTCKFVRGWVSSSWRSHPVAGSFYATPDHPFHQQPISSPSGTDSGANQQPTAFTPPALAIQGRQASQLQSHRARPGFLAPPPSQQKVLSRFTPRTFPSTACCGSTCMYVYTYAQKHTHIVKCSQIPHRVHRACCHPKTCTWQR